MPLQGIAERLGGRRDADALAVHGQPFLALRPGQQLLAVVGERLGAVDADIAAAEVLAQVAEDAHLEVASVGRMALALGAAHELAPTLRSKGQVDLVGDPLCLAVFVVQHDLERLDQVAILRGGLEAQSTRHPEHRSTPIAERLPHQRQVVLATPHADGLAVGLQLLQAAMRCQQRAQAPAGFGIVQVLRQQLEHGLELRDQVLAEFALTGLDGLQLASGPVVASADPADEHLGDPIACLYAHMADQGQRQ